MTRAERTAYVTFRDALLDFSDEPSLENLARYLEASRALGEVRGTRPTPAPVGRNREKPLAT